MLDLALVRATGFEKYSEITKDMVRRGEGAGVGTDNVRKVG